jgi:hypothetical protein
MQRCATADLNQSELEVVEQNVKARNESEKTTGSDRAEEYVLNVYFHVIMNSAGEGAVSDAIIGRQIRALNEGFEGTGFTFVLAGVDRTVNDE